MIKDHERAIKYFNDSVQLSYELLRTFEMYYTTNIQESGEYLLFFYYV